ncbi:hypothetical protein [Campylobacter showae]
MPSARSILLLLLAAASLRSRKLEKSSHDTSPYRFTFKFANLSRRDPYLENIKFDSNLRCDGAKFNLRIAQQPLTL